MDNPEDAKVWKNRGDDYVRKEKYNEAIQCYEYAITVDPEFLEAWNNYGYVLVKLGRKDEAGKIRDKINQITKKKEERIKESPVRGKKQLRNYLPRPNDPGFIPVKICILSFAVLILGYVVMFFSDHSTYISLIGSIGLLIAYLAYSVNIYESGQNYRFLAIVMLIVPVIPFYLLNTDNILLAIGALVFGFFLIWLIMVAVVRVKHVFIDTRKNPPNIFVAGLSILGMFLIYSAVLAAVFFGTYQTEYPLLSSTGCASPDIVCKGACYEPCPDGYVFDDASCRCRAEHTSSCGDTPCSSPGVCCKGTCYPACPAGYLFNTYDCRCYGQDYSSWAWIDYLG